MGSIRYLAIVVMLQVNHIYAAPGDQYCANVCQQCTTVCSSQANDGGRDSSRGYLPVGPRGEKGNKGDTGFPGLTGVKGERGRRGSPGSEAFGEAIDKRIQEVLYGGRLRAGAPYRSCRDARNDPARGPNIANGLINISIPALGQAEVYCDFTTDGGDWIVFQRRMDGSVDFYRNWEEYTDGFGDKHGEFWLGLETINQLTWRGKWEMRIELITVNDDRYFVKYSQFRISPDWQDYTLTVSGFSGNTTDSIGLDHHNMKFTTWDMDRDYDAARNCAVHWHGAWWYKYCHNNYHTNLNGRYNSTGYDGLSWYNHAYGWTTMKFTEMKMRPRFVD